MVVYNSIKRGMSLPATYTKGYCPIEYGQQSVTTGIYESEFLDDSYDFSIPHKRYIGTVELMLPPNSPKDLSLQCRLTLNVNGMLEVVASEPSGRNVVASFNIQSL